MKDRIIKAVIRWIWGHYRDVFNEVLAENSHHVHANPKKRGE